MSANQKYIQQAHAARIARTKGYSFADDDITGYVPAGQIGYEGLQEQPKMKPAKLIKEKLAASEPTVDQRTDTNARAAKKLAQEDDDQ